MANESKEFDKALWDKGIATYVYYLWIWGSALALFWNGFFSSGSFIVDHKSDFTYFIEDFGLTIIILGILIVGIITLYYLPPKGFGKKIFILDV